MLQPMLISQNQNQKRLVVLASGEGTLFEAIAQKCLQGAISAEVVSLITHKDEVGAVYKAYGLGLPVVVVNPKDFTHREDWDRQLYHILETLAPDLVVLAGFTQKLGLMVVRQFYGRIINSHPSLLPQYGGQGMYGRRVHEAVLQGGEKVTGVTVHWVTPNYDEGPALAQVEVAVEANDSVDSLMERVKTVEREFYPQVIQLFFEGQISPLVEAE